MIPNAGLDNIAAYAAWSELTGSTAAPSGSEWLAYAAISEDSTAPSASDTNIGVEKMRTNSTGGFSRSSSAIRDGTTNRLGVSIERAYVFAITSSMNITKYGYVPVSAGGNFSWIDLTRVDPNDPLSTPVTITLVNGDQLQLWQTLTITVPWSVDLESFVITGTAGNDTNGTHDAYCGFYAANATLIDANTNDVLSATIGSLFWPGASSSISATATSQVVSSARDQSLASNTGAAESAFRAWDAYSLSAYYRDARFKFTTSAANFAITGIALLSAAGIFTNRPNNGHGFKIVFDDPSTFTKDSLHELTLTFRVSWAEG